MARSPSYPKATHARLQPSSAPSSLVINPGRGDFVFAQKTRHGMLLAVNQQGPTMAKKVEQAVKSVFNPAPSISDRYLMQLVGKLNSDRNTNEELRKMLFNNISGTFRARNFGTVARASTPLVAVLCFTGSTAAAWFTGGREIIGNISGHKPQV